MRGKKQKERRFSLMRGNRHGEVSSVLSERVLLHECSRLYIFRCESLLTGTKEQSSRRLAEYPSTASSLVAQSTSLLRTTHTLCLWNLGPLGSGELEIRISENYIVWFSVNVLNHYHHLMRSLRFATDVVFQSFSLSRQSIIQLSTKAVHDSNTGRPAVKIVVSGVARISHYSTHAVPSSFSVYDRTYARLVRSS